MQPSTKNKIKKQIIADLQKLVATNVLGSVVAQDLNSKDPFQGTYEKYPVAIVGLASMTSAYETNLENLRTYSFPILIIQRLENTTTPEDIEDLEEAVTNAFDNDVTLLGNANGAVEAVPTDTATNADRTLIGIVVTIKAKALVELSFPQ